MSSGGRKKNKGGLGLTEAVSTGLLIAAEELYRNSLKKKKRGGGAEAGVTDGGTLSVQDIMNGGKRRARRRGGADGALLTDAFGKSLTGGKKKRGGEGTQFNMEEIVKEAELAAENHVGGRRRRRGRPCGSGSKKGGAAFGDFVNAISGQAGAIASVAGVNTTPQVNPAEPKPETFASVDQDGGKKKKKRSYRKKRGGQDEQVPFPLNPLNGYPSATQEGGKQRRRGGAIEGLDPRDGALLTDAFGKSLTGGKKKRGKGRGGQAYKMTVDCNENEQKNGNGDELAPGAAHPPRWNTQQWRRAPPDPPNFFVGGPAARPAAAPVQADMSRMPRMATGMLETVAKAGHAMMTPGGAKKRKQKKRTYKKKKGGDAQEQINGIFGMLKNYL